MTKKIKFEKQSRDFTFKREDIDEEKRTIKLSFSSELPVRRWYGMEILDHNAGSVRLGRLKDSGPLLMDHNRKDQVGVVESVEIGTDKRGYAVVRFGKSPRAEEIYQDVLDGIRRSVSVDYATYKHEKTEGENGKPDTYRFTDWEPLEISMVAVPADAGVGIGRDESLEKEIINPNEEEDEMRNLQNKKKFEANKDSMPGGDNGTREKEEPVIDIQVVQNEARDKALKDERHRSKEILAYGKQFGKEEDARSAVESGMALSEFKDGILRGLGAEPIIEPDPSIGLTENETEEFSILRGIRSISIHGDLSGAPFENECSQAVIKKFGGTERERGFSVPHEVANQKRDMKVVTDTAGGNLVDTTLMIQSFIDLLRNNTIVAQMGATILDGLVGDIAIPRETGGCTSYWLNENDAIDAESNPTIDQIGMTPKTIGAYTEISRKLLMQSSLDVENFVRSRLAMALALGMDLASIMGTGIDKQPKGIINQTGIGLISKGRGSKISWADVVNLESEVAIDNAALGSLGYLTNARVVGSAKQTEKADKTGQFIMSGHNKPGFNDMNGYPVGVTNQVPSKFSIDAVAADGSKAAKDKVDDLSALIFGNWSDLIIGYWGSLDILVDPFKHGLSGKLRIRVLRDTDLAVAHPQSFSIKKDIITQ